MRSACAQLAAVGVALIAAGQLSSRIVPINKRLWTSSFTVLTTGFALVFLALAVALVDGRVRPATPRTPVRVVEALGRNALVAYIGSEELHYVLNRYHAPGGGTKTYRRWAYDALARALPANLASAAYGLAIVALFAIICALMNARKIYVRV